MVRRAGLLSLLLAPLGACTLWSNMLAAKPAADCPPVTRATAWVDQMPRIGSGDHKMIVALSLDDDRAWLLTPVPSGTRGLLTLELSPGGPAVPGHASYREPAGKAKREAISIVCGGVERTRITQITITM
ncbi:MAG: hypothetical protein VR74_19585 [Hyphomonas sp. BRH_c22]|uniref:hypothetical protein n=1 Tax=Hyphomonas sp. BRH_c22 TaxID=1629710 RepID=UPI0005F1D56B|nr:hypothetical protein [Hyphomonas sp. BRH_c22]KJS34649.1 MAG: hypothetical protein VR74_19585 [Hyphomonas sp. BRH_c22]